MSPRIHRLAPALLAGSALVAGTLGLAVPAQAVTTHTVSGTIVDSAGHPVSGASLELYSDNDVAYDDGQVTTANGQYSFTAPDAGDLELDVTGPSKGGYAGKSYYPNNVGSNAVQNVTLYTTTETNNCSAPTISGTPSVGSTVTATGVNISAVQWGYSTGQNGGPIDGATSTALQIPAAIFGKDLVVIRSFAAGVDYGNDCDRSAGVRVTQGGAVPIGGAPSVAHTGAAKPGTTLTASPGVLPAGSTVAYQWVRIVKKSGHHRLVNKPIAGATGASYKLKKKDKGTKVFAQMVVTNPAYAAHTVSTKPVKVKK